MRDARRVRASAVLAALVCIATCAASRARPPCEARLSVRPQRAFVGEQVLYALEIHRREDVRSIHWARPLTASGFRIESLPARTDLPPREPGERSLGVEERRALFPTRAGELEIPSARLRCTLATEGGERDVDVAVPSARILVTPVPESGRPPGFSGVVGQPSVRSWIDPARLALGGSASLTVLVEGRANLWELPPPFDPEDPPIPGVDFLARPSEIARDAGRALRLRRYFFYDLVPREVGSFEVPALSVPYFDPQSASFATATAPALRLEVHAPPAPEARAQPRTSPARERASPTARRAATVAVAGLVLGAAAAALILWARHRSDGARRQARELLDRAAAERSRGRPGCSNTLLARALRVALEERLPAARSSSAEELLAAAGHDPELAQAASLLARLDAARFSAAPDRAPDPDSVRRAVLRVSCARPPKG